MGDLNSGLLCRRLVCDSFVLLVPIREVFEDFCTLEAREVTLRVNLPHEGAGGYRSLHLLTLDSILIIAHHLAIPVRIYKSLSKLHITR